MKIGITENETPYLRVYKPHFFDKNLTSKIGVRLIHGIKNQDPPRKGRYHTDQVFPNFFGSSLPLSSKFFMHLPQVPF
jgi:hypothetical protein